MEKMDYQIILVFFSIWICIQFLTSRLLRRKSGKTKLPPGPKPFPVIGNLLELGSKPHHSLANLSKIYGPLMTLKLGSITTIVISSPTTAKEVLAKNDHLTSGRAIPAAIQHLNHHEFSMVWLPVNARWRNLRKICSLQMFTAPRLDAGQALRRKKLQELVNHVHESCSTGEAIDIGGVAFTTSLNLLSNTLFSIDFAHYNSNSSQEFKDLAWGVMEEIGRPNIAGYFPVLRFIDLQGVRRRMRIYFKKLIGIFDGIVNQRTQLRASPTAMTSAAKNDVLDALLNIAKESDCDLSRNDINHLLLDLFVAGTDTTSSTLEWAMAELLHNPKTMAKARFEIEQVLGNKDRAVIQEADIPRLPYLQAVVKETLRLHPPAPFLVPHKSETDVEISGFTVPKNSQILTNVWATGRDRSIWTDPNLFKPERFVECKIDFKGQDFELIPFGAGRRICPGLPLANRMIPMMLASLLHSFEWKLEKGIKPEDMDMSDKFGLTLKKAEPLRAIPIKA